MGNMKLNRTHPTGFPLEFLMMKFVFCCFVNEETGAK